MSELINGRCPECGGHNGMHIWAGSGSCPGMNPVDPLTQLRAKVRLLNQRVSMLEQQLRTLHRYIDELEKQIEPSVVEEIRDALRHGGPSHTPWLPGTAAPTWVDP
jgi:hypothetical protein